MPAPSPSTGPGFRTRERLVPATTSRALLQWAQVDGAGLSSRIRARGEDLGLLDLLGTRGRKRVDKEDPPRRLVVGEPVEAPPHEALCRGHVTADPRHRHHASHHFFLAQLVGHGEHRDLADVLVRLQHGFDLGGGDVLARAADDVLLTVHEDQHVVGHPARDVAGVKPAATPRLVGRLRVLEVAVKESVPRTFRSAPPDEQLALGSPRDLLITVVRHAGFEATPRPAESPRVYLARLDAVGVDTSRLRHAPYLDEREAEALLEGLVQLRLDTRPEAELHTGSPLFGRG